MKFTRYSASERIRVIAMMVALPFLALPVVIGSFMLIQQGSILNMNFGVTLFASVAAFGLILLYGRETSRAMKAREEG